MSWSKVKKINGDMKKSLDTLIKEQFNTNNSNVSTVKNDLTTVKSDLTYIKNTQLGTNLNNLLNGSSMQTIDFNNKPLVDKVNYLLVDTGNLSFTSTGNNILGEKSSQTTNATLMSNYSGKVIIMEYTPKYDGQVKIEIELKYYSNGGTYSSNMGLAVSSDKSTSAGNLSILIATPNSTTFVKKSAILNVIAGQTLQFSLILKSVNKVGTACQNFKILGDIVFKNPY